MQQLSYQMPRLFTYRKSIFQRIEGVYRRPTTRRTRRTKTRKIPVTYPIEVKEHVKPKETPSFSSYMIDDSILDVSPSSGAATGLLINGPAPVYQYSQLTSTSRFKSRPTLLLGNELRSARLKARVAYLSLVAVMRRFFGNLDIASLKRVIPGSMLSTESIKHSLRKTKAWSLAATPIIVIALLGMHVLTRPETSPQNAPALPQTAFDRPAPDKGASDEQTQGGQNENNVAVGSSSAGPTHHSQAASTHQSDAGAYSSTAADDTMPSEQPVPVGGFGGGTTYDYGSNAPAAPVPSETGSEPSAEGPVAPEPQEPAGLITVPGQTIEIGDIEVLQMPEISL